MAAITPTGTAVKAVTSITREDPTQAARMPACAARRDGKEVRKSTVNRSAPSITRRANSTTSAVRQENRATSPITTKT